MILNRDHGGFRAQRAVVAFEDTNFQNTASNDEANFARRAELDDRVLKKNVLVFVDGRIAIAVAVGAAELDGTAWSGLGKKSTTMLSSRARASGWGARKLNPGGAGAGEPPLFPVWKRVAGRLVAFPSTRMGLRATGYRGKFAATFGRGGFIAGWSRWGLLAVLHVVALQFAIEGGAARCWASAAPPSIAN